VIAARRFAAVLLTSSGVLPAIASAADIKPVVTKACFGRAGQEITRDRLAAFVLSEVGLIDEDLQKDPVLSKEASPSARAVSAMRSENITGVSEEVSEQIFLVVQSLEQSLASTSNQTAKQVGLSVANAPKMKRGWLFEAGQTWIITCGGKADDGSISPSGKQITQFEKGVTREILSLRKTVAELGLTGDEAKKAGAAQVGFKRERVKQDDGSTKTSTTVTIDGTAGLRLTSPNAQAPVYAYGSYTLSRARKKPAPALADGKKQSDDDTDVLEVGGAISGLLVRSRDDFSIVAFGQTGYVMDYVGHSRRARLRAGFTPGIPFSIGQICDLGGFNQSDVLGLRFRSRCTVQIEMEISHVFKVGTTDFHEHGEFLGVGATLGYDLAAPISKDAAILGNIRYRLVPTVWGAAPNVERVDASIKYRFYTESALGIDLGLTWAKGNEPKSLKKEDKLELGFGLIF
jgi:hypothetical protein